jgi:hypothetical protein
MSWMRRPAKRDRASDASAGLLGYYGLREWWDSTFSPEEQRFIEGRHQPLGGGLATLTEGHISSTSQSAAGLLWALAGWFNKPGERHIARRVLSKAEEIANDAVDRHFVYSQLIDVTYPEREREPGALDEAIRACEAQIALGSAVMAGMRAEQADRERFLADRDGETGRAHESRAFQAPGHRGFTQLAIIREKEGNLEAAIALAKQAKAQGWTGDWDNRIDRLRKKTNRSGSAAE